MKRAVLGRRIAVDTGGTFTDLIVEDNYQRLRIYKAGSIPEDPIRGVMDALHLAARDFKIDRRMLLSETDLFIHGTTRATNAIVTGQTARTGFLTTQGHPDILTYREGGRSNIFDFTQFYPDPYIPRSLTFEVPERIASDGSVVTPLDSDVVRSIIRTLKAQRVDAVAVCLLWSVVNSTHELRIAELLDEYLPGVPYTLSHVINPIIREYRRASSTAIDASLKPLMSRYCSDLRSRLEADGFAGRLLIVTSSGGVLDAHSVESAPIHSIGSGPAVAPVGGRHFAQLEGSSDTAIIADAGGTTYDVTLVRRGRIPWTRETWLNGRFTGHMTGFASVDVKSIGAGGGSIAWVDAGGLLRIGPASAGAVPGPACYGRGGRNPTVTDACVVLRYLDPGFFLGGGMDLSVDAAFDAMSEHVGAILGMNAVEASAGVFEVATQQMVYAIEEITLKQGIDPRDAVLLAGGGAGGLNAVAIARALGCSKVIIPELAAGLSAVGALMSDLTADFTRTFVTSTRAFDFSGVNDVLSDLQGTSRQFLRNAGSDLYESSIALSAECRYPHQVWELEVPFSTERFKDDGDVAALGEAFHDLHRQVFAIDDPQSHVEIVAWHARARCRLREIQDATLFRETSPQLSQRKCFFRDAGWLDCDIRFFQSVPTHTSIWGPAIVESDTTTIVIPPGASARRLPGGSLVINPWAERLVGDERSEANALA